MPGIQGYAIGIKFDVMCRSFESNWKLLWINDLPSRLDAAETLKRQLELPSKRLGNAVSICYGASCASNSKSNYAANDEHVTTCLRKYLSIPSAVSSLLSPSILNTRPLQTILSSALLCSALLCSAQC